MASGDEVVIGKQDMTEQPGRFREVNGVEATVREFRGPRDGIPGKMADLRVNAPLGTIFEVDSAAPASIIMTSPTADDRDLERNAVWELIGNDLDKPLALHPYYKVSGTDASIIEEADAAIRKGTAGQVDWDTLHATLNIQHYVDLRLRGVDTFISFSYIVRKTLTFTEAREFEAAFDRVTDIPGGVISWRQVGVPPRAKFKQPKVRTWDPDDLKWENKFLVEWLVKSPTIRWVKKPASWSLVREYWGAELWAENIYDGGTWLPNG